MPPYLLAVGLAIYVVSKIITKRDNMPGNKIPPMKFTPLIPSDWAGWVWPVPIYQNRRPTISHGFEAGSRYLPDGTLNKGAHMGVDIMFPRAVDDPTEPKDSVAIPKGGKNPGWIAPSGTPIVAAGPGMIWRAGDSARGKWIQIDHGNMGVNTYYQHLEQFAKPWKKGDVVQAGELLGLMGGDPSTNKLRHLHFELWKPVKGENQNLWPKDPAPVMRYWSIINSPIT